MAKAEPSNSGISGKLGREIHYTRFGREYVRHVPAHYNDRKSEAQLRVRPLPAIEITGFRHEGLHVDVSFNPNLDYNKARQDDIVHFYAVSPQADFCELTASVYRESGHATFDLPDLSDDPDCTEQTVFYIYAITESIVTAGTPTLSADEKQANKRHRNINRKVSRSVFAGYVTLR